jgi:hypothetical protein
LRHFDGSWLAIQNYTESSNARSDQETNSVWPWDADWQLGQNLDAKYGMLPAVVQGDYSAGNVYGELQGVRHISGFANASENTATVGSDSYLVFQALSRSGRRDYAGVLLA